MIFLATAVALCDVLFVLVAVPESLPEKVRPVSWGAAISWEQADPFNVSNTCFANCAILLFQVQWCITIYEDRNHSSSLEPMFKAF